MNKTEILNIAKADLQSADQQRTDQDTKIKKWKAEYNGEPYGNEQKGKSTIVSRDIKKQSEWQHASIIDPFVSSVDIIKCAPITWEDKLAAMQNELVLNTQFCRQFNRFNFMTKAAKILDTEGTVVVQCGWEYEDEEVEEEVPLIDVDEYGNEYISGVTTATNIKILKNQPTAVVCRNEDIYIDPTCMGDYDKAQFVIHRYESDLSTLKQDGNYKNLDKIKVGNSSQEYGDTFEPEDTTDFRFKDKARKKILVHEYWGNMDIDGDGIAEPIVLTWVDDVIIRLSTNPYPDRKHPFIIVPFNSIPFEMYGEPNAALISDNQKVKTAILRGILDNMAQSNNGMKGIRKGALDSANKAKFMAGKNFEFNGTPNDFYDGNYTEIPSIVYNMLDLMNNDIESITGTKSFSQGITGNSLGGTATGARGVLDATATRRLNVVRNISENLIKPLMRKWISYNSEFLEEEEIIRITNDEFVPIKRDDLAGRIDIDIQVSTSEDNKNKAQELSFMMQTIGPNMDPSITRMLMADIARLHKIPDVAKRIEEWQEPQPSPEQQRGMQLDLAMKEAQLRNELAKAGENEVDIRLKSAKTINEEAKARNLNAKSDLEDLNFIKEDDGVKHREMLEIEQLKGQNTLDQKAFDALYGNKSQSKK